MDTQKRFIIRVLKVSLLATLLTPLFSWSQTKWDLASGYPISNPHTMTLQQFVNDVNASSVGKLTITLHPGGSLLKVPEIKRGVQTHQVAMGEVIMSVLENENPIFGLDSIPFLVSGFNAADKLWKIQRPYVEKALAAQGIQLLYAVPWPPQGLFAKKPINTVADLKGLKWRTYNPTTQRIAKEYGAQPVTIQASELSQALATGVVEAFMTSGATGVDSKVWESGVTNFYSVDAWLPKNMVMVNKTAFNQLDPATQKIVLKTAQEAETKGWARMRAYTDDSYETLKKNKIQVSAPTGDFSQEMVRFGITSFKEWVAKAGADGQAIAEAYGGKK